MELSTVGELTEGRVRKVKKNMIKFLHSSCFNESDINVIIGVIFR